VLKRPKALFNKGTCKLVMWFQFEEYGSYNTVQCVVALADQEAGPLHVCREDTANPSSVNSSLVGLSIDVIRV
jgi:hypothetical protein